MADVMQVHGSAAPAARRWGSERESREMPRHSASVLLLFLVLFASAPVMAQTPTEEADASSVPQRPEAPDEGRIDPVEDGARTLRIEDGILREGERRPLPDYDGRGEEEMTVGEGLLWVPRVLFFPVYLVSEYVIRRPIGYVVTEAERNDWPRLVFDFFTFEEGRIGIVPTAFYEFGFKPSVGFYLWWDDFIVDGNALRLSFAFWGEDWIHLALADRVRIYDGGSIAARLDVKRRQDAKFVGIGPLSRSDDKARYELTHLEGGLEFDTDLGDYFNLRIGSSVLHEHFGRPDSPDMSVEEAVEAGVFDALPPGFGGFSAYRTSVDFWLDTRFGERPTSETGVRVFTHAEHAVSLTEPDSLQWVRYGAALGGFVNLGYYRTIGLKLQTAFADPLLDQDVPFTQLISIGGSEFSSNVAGDRLLGRSAVWTTLEYLWPIWVWLDGSVNVSFGNAFGAHLEDFKWDLLRWSVGFGFATVGEPDQTFELTFGFLGDTFREGGGLDEFRFFFGANSAF